MRKKAGISGWVYNTRILLASSCNNNNNNNNNNKVFIHQEIKIHIFCYR